MTGIGVGGPLAAALGGGRRAVAALNTTQAIITQSNNYSFISCLFIFLVSRGSQLLKSFDD